MLPYSTEDLWSTLMELEKHSDEAKKLKGPQKFLTASADTSTSEKYLVSRFGALLAASLLRLPGDTDHRIIEK